MLGVALELTAKPAVSAYRQAKLSIIINTAATTVTSITQLSVVFVDGSDSQNTAYYHQNPREYVLQGNTDEEKHLH